MVQIGVILLGQLEVYLLHLSQLHGAGDTQDEIRVFGRIQRQLNTSCLLVAHKVKRSLTE